MSDLLAQSEAWLADQQRQFASQVRYTRGVSVVTPNPVATIGRTSFELDNGVGDGGTITVQSRDFIILASALSLASAPITPKAGDRITEGGYVYEVMTEPVWRWADPNRIRYRIHTKQIGPAS